MEKKEYTYKHDGMITIRKEKKHKIKYHLEGHCPYCKSEDIEYEHSYISGTTMYFPIICNSCDMNSKEWHDIVYNETIGDIP